MHDRKRGLITDSSPDTDTDRLETLVKEVGSTDCDDQVSIQALLSELIRISGRTIHTLKLAKPRFRQSDWPHLNISSKDQLTKQDANKFLCGCILEYQAGKVDIWDNTTWFIEEILSDPENLWALIKNHNPADWHALFWEYNLHPEERIHDRLWEVANRMVRYYQGDARQIWSEYKEAPHEVFKRLRILGLPRSTACLVIGALKDEGYIQGKFDIVGDIVDSRVIARLVLGESGGLTSYQARYLTRMIAPDDPWVLDRPLYVLGMSYCIPGPRCGHCPVRSRCTYAICKKMGVTIGKKLHGALFSHKTIQKSLRPWQ